MKQEQKNEITKIYTHIYNLENITASDRTPIIDAFGYFIDDKFCQGYKDQTVNFLTDFGDNESKGEFKDLYNKIMSDNSIGGSNNNTFGIYNTYSKKDNPTNKDKQKIKEIKSGINKYFEKSKIVQSLQQNLLKNSTTINFIYPGSKTLNNLYSSFFSLLGEYINKESDKNPTGKQLITFQKLDRNEDLFVPKNYQPKESKYKRESVSVTLTNKSNPSETITQTVKVGEKKTT